MTDRSKKPLTIKNRQGEIASGEDQPRFPAKGHLLQREKAIRAIAIVLGIMVLGYIYTDSLWAQQATQQRISISQATNFPRDI